MRWLLPLVIAACGGSHTPPAKPIPVPTPEIPADDIAVAKRDAKPARDDGMVVKDPRVIDLDIIRIGPGDTGSVATADLFRDANERAKAGNTQGAIARYRQLVSEFKDSLYAPISLFNIAAILDKQGDVPGTISVLRELIATYPDSRESVEGQLYIAALQAEKKEWAAALSTLELALGRPQLTYADRVEALARKGYLLIELHRYDDADAALAAATTEWRKAPRIDDSYYIAMASYYAGEIAHRKFTEAPVRLPDAQLLADLEAKRHLAVQAYDRWKTSLGYNHAYWGTASGYQMSQIFFELWEITVKAPYPTNLSAATRDKYVLEVHEKARPHLEKALKGHQMNIELAKAYGVETLWSKGSAQRAVQMMETLARDAAGQYVTP